MSEILTLLSTGASGAIVMALGGGPLRTKELTQRLPRYAPRTVYRYVSRLVDLGVVERHEEPGVPSKVVHALTDPCGTELFELLESFVDGLLTRLPSGEVDAHGWALLGLLADLWRSGLIEELNGEGRSPTELARRRSNLSYHQVNRRAGLLTTIGLLEEAPGVGRRRRYVLTDKARRATAMIAAIGCWRERHLASPDAPALSARETATVLRTLLPLVRVEKGAGARLELCVDPRGEVGEGAERLWVRIDGSGTLEGVGENGSADAWARGEVRSWLTAVLGERQGRLQLGGNRRLIEDCLSRLPGAVRDGGIDSV